MHITTIALIIAIIGLLSSSLLVGGFISLVSLIMGIFSLRQEKSIEAVRIIAISAAGLVVPFIMYFNTYGINLPKESDAAVNPYREILSTNFTNMGIAMAGDNAKDQGTQDPDQNVAASFGTTASAELQQAIARAGKESDPDASAEEEGVKELIAADDNRSGDGVNPASDGSSEDEMVYIGLTDSVKRGVIEHMDDGLGSADEAKTGDEKIESDNKKQENLGAAKAETEDAPKSDNIFESLDSISPEDRNKGGIISIAARDDDMPSYGGLPVGTLLIAQYFREDDHNANPVLVLQNKTGDLARYECKFIARDARGNGLSVSEKTVEVVRNGSLFVFEGRFNKKDMGGKKPAVYEFSITKRTPYEKDMASQVSLYTSTSGTSSVLTAVNNSDRKIKVDAYVLYFDGTELVDCMWMIPQNTDEVCLYPGTTASIQGDSYYRFDRVETYYTAYEAIEGQ